jgi:hypothetical protein
MGLLNNQVIKIGVDSLTGLLNVVNKLTSSEGLGGLVGTMAKVMLTLLSLKSGKALFNGLIGSAGEAFKNAGKTSGDNFKNAFTKEFEGILGKVGKLKEGIISSFAQKSLLIIDPDGSNLEKITDSYNKLLGLKNALAEYAQEQ